MLLSPSKKYGIMALVGFTCFSVFCLYDIYLLLKSIRYFELLDYVNFFPNHGFQQKEIQNFKNLAAHYYKLWSIFLWVAILFLIPTLVFFYLYLKQKIAASRVAPEPRPA